MAKYKTEKDVYEALKASFDEKAYSPLYKGDRTLTSIRAQYVVERLNEVLGIGNWKVVGEWKDVEESIVFIGELTYTLPIEGAVEKSTGPVAGASDDRDVGDAFKSARTDCLTKAASLLGVGNDVFKGLVNLDESPLKPEDKKQDTKPTKTLKSRFSTPAPKVEETQSEEANESEEEAVPAVPSKLKPSRMFRRPTAKLNESKA